MSLTSSLPNSVYGPYLKFLDYKKATADGAVATWTGSILYVCNKSIVGNNKVQYCLKVRGNASILDGIKIDSYGDWEFWKFHVSLGLTSQEQQVEYKLKLGENDTSQPWWSFYVPGAEQNWHISSYSCSGFSYFIKEEDWMVDGDHPLVQNLVKTHGNKKIHASLAVGDQLYCDQLFDQPTMSEWVKVSNRGERLGKPFSQTMKSELEDFYFAHYCQHFDVPAMKKICAQIPHVKIWDDHDIFDGWGSYPDDMMQCAVFNGIFGVAKRFYLLFQHHTTQAIIDNGSSDFIVGSGDSPSLSFLKNMGPDLAVVGVDIRSERSKNQINTEATWTTVFNELEKLSSDIKHLIVVFSVPIVCSGLDVAEAALSFASTVGRVPFLNSILAKTNIFSEKSLGEPALLDDLVDRWTSGHHTKERQTVVSRFQTLASNQNLRVTFLSGDVHHAGFGGFHSEPTMSDLTEDPRYMPQLITSALINPPPSKMILSLMNMGGVSGNSVNKGTGERMVDVFATKFSSEPTLLAKRNFLTIEKQSDHELEAIFYVEDEENMTQDPVTIKSYIPHFSKGIGS